MYQGTKSAIGDQMPSILDRELTDCSDDAFGHSHFAQALRNLIESPHSPPYSIGLLGSWGTGKSTIKQLYLSSLENDMSGQKGKKRKDRIHPIIFNAWRYGGEEDIKRALLRHAFIQLGGDEIALHEKLYQQVNRSSQTKRNLWEWLKETVCQNATSVLIFVLLLAAVIIIFGIFANVVGINEQWGLSFLVPTAGTVSIFLAKYVVDIRLKSPTLFNPQTTISFPSTSSQEYERLLLEQIAKFRQSPAGRSCERLVVFVDDLDRLSAPEMVAGLDAVRTFLELPVSNASEKFGVVFVISCDEDRVADALSPRGRVRVNPDLPASVRTRWDARRYLDRLFQFRLEIPHFPKLDMRQFAEKKLRVASNIASEIEHSGVRLQDVVERLIHVGVQSPRNAIQILNAFIQTWWISVQREQSGAISNAPGALYQGAVTKHPLALAALCVLRVDFPDFYNELQNRPDLINEFTKVVFRGQSIDSIAIGGQEALSNFLIVGSDGELRNEVRSEYRGLRQYLSSLNGLRWPKSIQPLLLLSQDVVSRKFGDRATELHSAFVSGDIQGVLEVLGHHLDGDDLSRDDVHLLEDLAEGLSDETEARRINASRVLATLAHRIPLEYRSGLMMPLARQMVSIKDIRMNVGPSLVGEVIKSLHLSDKQDVIESFACDLLLDSKVEWRLPTGETPSLEELVLAVKETVTVVLNVRKSDELLAKTDGRLKNWLLSREVQSEAGSQTLAFGELESWLSDHDESLLMLLGEEYADQAIAEFERESGKLSDDSITLDRVAVVHTQLAESGQESRQILWQQLQRLVSSRASNASAAAWRTAGIHAALATDTQSRDFLIALAFRLQKEMEDDKGWPLDWNTGAKQFLDLITRWEDNIDAKTAKAFVPLLISWSDVDNCTEFMVRGAGTLLKRDRESWNLVVDHIISNSLTELPWSTLKYVARKIDFLTEEQLSVLVKRMNEQIDTDQFDMDGITNYQKFVSLLPSSNWSSALFQAHARKLRTRLTGLFNNADYLSAYFLVSRNLLNYAPNGEAAAFLKQLFEQAAGAPSAYPILHREMVGYWPDEGEQIGRYDPTGIAQRAIQFIRENPTVAGIDYVLTSVTNLIDRNLTAENIRTLVSSAAASLWHNAPDAVVAYAKNMAGDFSPTDVKSIATGKQPSDFKIEQLQFVLSSVAIASDQVKCISIAKEILGVTPKAINDMPDGAFSTWCLSLAEKATSVLTELCFDNKINDLQKERVFRFAVSHRKSLGFDFFTEILPKFITNPTESVSQATAISKIDEIAELALTKDDKHALVSVLISIIPNVPKSTLSAIATVISGAGGKKTLERSNILDKLDRDQLLILSSVFPDSKVFSQLADSEGRTAE